MLLEWNIIELLEEKWMEECQLIDMWCGCSNFFAGIIINNCFSLKNHQRERQSWI